MRKPPGSTAFLMWGAREIVCPLICQSKGKHGERYGSFWSGATAAVEREREAADRRGEPGG